MAKNELKIALAGNPNTGKTSLFNVLTGMTQKVGNYPGVTVDKKEGKCEINDQQALIIDLPGTYSMNPNSLDESVVLNTLLKTKFTFTSANQRFRFSDTFGCQYV